MAGDAARARVPPSGGRLMAASVPPFVDVPTIPDPYDVMAQVARRSGVALEHILSNRRDRHVAHARHQVMHELRAIGLSLPSIGRLLRRDHTTVMYGLRSFSKAAGAPSEPASLSYSALAERRRCVDMVLEKPVPKELRHHLEALAERMRA